MAGVDSASIEGWMTKVVAVLLGISVIGFSKAGVADPVEQAEAPKMTRMLNIFNNRGVEFPLMQYGRAWINNNYPGIIQLLTGEFHHFDGCEILRYTLIS